jgi:hypothetical protein
MRFGGCARGEGGFAFLPSYSPARYFALFAAKADEVRSMEQGAWSMERERPEVAVFRKDGVQQEEKADEARTPSSPRAQSGEEVRSGGQEEKSFQCSVFSVQQEEKAEEVRKKSDE